MTAGQARVTAATDCGLQPLTVLFSSLCPMGTSKKLYFPGLGARSGHVTTFSLMGCEDKY